MATAHSKTGLDEHRRQGRGPTNSAASPDAMRSATSSQSMRCFATALVTIAAIIGTASGFALFRSGGGSESAQGASTDSLEAPEVVDLGEAPIHGVIPYEIALRNTSAEASLRLEHVFSTCGCTTTTPAPVVLPAGERGVVSGEFTLPEAVSRDSASSAVYIGTSEASRKRVLLRARVVSPFPEEVALTADGDVVIPLHELYRAGVRDIACYAGVSDTPLPLWSSCSSRSA